MTLQRDTGVPPAPATKESAQLILPTPRATRTGETPVSRLAVDAAKMTARAALGLIWVYEGLVPKLLYTTQQEIDLVARSHVYWPTPQATLATLGVCEILGGLWLLWGRSEKAAAALSFALVAVVGPACAVLDPSILYHPFGGLSKNLALLACAAVVWLLSPAQVSAKGRRGAAFFLSSSRAFAPSRLCALCFVRSSKTAAPVPGVAEPSAKPGANLPENEWGGGGFADVCSDNHPLCSAKPSADLRPRSFKPGPFLPLHPGEGRV